MGDKPAIRAVAAVAVAGAGLVAALALGAPLAAALLAALAGIAAFALAPSAAERRRPPWPATLDDDPDALPGIAELLRAVDEPMLIVRARRVIAANAAARTLLGHHIEGSDVRLALRHPAATERLAGADEIHEGTANSDCPHSTRVELVGIGEADRHWLMTVTNLQGGSRLVRLSDQSAVRAADQMRADFVANASHELRTPLATVIGFVETLQDEQAGSDPGTRTRFLKIMADEATRMRDLVDDLMSLSRIEAERFTAPTDPVDLVPLIERVIDGLKPLAAARGAAVGLENEARSTIVQGDDGQLAQLFSNLVSNALKYGRAGAPVRVRLESAGSGMLRVRVIDQGEGIAPEHIPRLTERFYRVDPGRSRSEGGTGLGLAIAKHIALRHRGRLEIVSKPGEGTSVQVYLPHGTEGAE